MTTEQFKILCRAYWPDCYFAESYGATYCYPDSWVRLGLDGGFAHGWIGEEADELIVGKPEDNVKKVYNDMRSRDA